MTVRETAVRWEDPQKSADLVGRISGLEFLQRMKSGEVADSPMASHINMTMVEVAEGTVTFESIPDESHYNPLGTVHGGLVCTLLDSALGCAAHTLLPAGMGYTSIEISTNYLRPVLPDSAPLRCTGRVVKAGRRVSFTEGEVVDRHGKIVATGQSTLLIFPLEGREQPAS